MENVWKEIYNQSQRTAEAYAGKTGALSATLEILATRFEIEARYSENQETIDFLANQIKFIKDSLAEADDKFNNRVA